MEAKTNDHLQTLREMRSRAVLGGGTKRIEQQHARGKLTARERLALLLDEGSFQEFGALATHQVSDFGLDKQRFPGDGIVTGFGKVSGRRVAVFAQDFTVLGGSFSEVQAQKISRIQDLALESGIPIIGLNDSGGARIQEGVRSLAAYGEVFVRNVMASGVIPQISLILGPCAGGAVYSPALTDFIIMAGDSYMFLTGPDVIKAVTGEEVTRADAGRRRRAHRAQRRGPPGAPTPSWPAWRWSSGCSATCRRTTTRTRRRSGPTTRPDRMDDALNTLIPNDENQPYDMRDAITAIFDRDSFLEIQPRFAANAVVGFARLDGYSVGVVANQPAFMSGALNIDASDKIARFIRICDAFNMPIVTFVDCPGFLPGIDQEYGGVIRHGAKIIYAYCEATVPKISIVTRKAMGGAYVAMSSKQMRTDLAFAWPTAQIAVMGAEPAVRVLYRDEVKQRRRPGGARARAGGRLPRAVLQPLPRRRRRPDRRGDRAARDPPAPGARARGAAHQGAAEPAQETRPVADMSHGHARTTMDNLIWGLQMTVLGMGLVFGLLALLWGLLTLVLRLDRAAGRGRVPRRPRRRSRSAAAPPAGARRPACGHGRRAGGGDPGGHAGAPRAAPARGRAGDAQLLARQPAVCVALGRRRAGAAEPAAGEEGQVMRRYTLGLRGREFVIDVQELAADRFEVRGRRRSATRSR